MDADVEPHGTVEGRELVDQEIAKIIFEIFMIPRRFKVAILKTPSRDGVSDAIDHLFGAGFPLRRAKTSAKVLGCDDIYRRLRPKVRNFDIGLLEDYFAVAFGDLGVASSPRDRVVGIAFTEQAVPRKTGRLWTRYVIDHIG